MNTATTLWHDRPAGQDWNRAYPLGCGRLGAMVFGNIAHERLQLNEDSLWSGGRATASIRMLCRNWPRSAG